MKVLVIGATGMLGHRLCRHFTARGDDVAGTAIEGGEVLARLAQVFEGVRLFPMFDVMAHGALELVLDEFRPDAAINAVGIVKQRPEAKDALISVGINSFFPHVLRKQCVERGIRMVHMSTDCVFSGKKGVAYYESDPSDAEDLYGRSKYLGEVTGPGALTIRTSIIGRELTTTQGLVEWFISQKGKAVRGYSKAIYTGLTTNELARVIEMVLKEYPEMEGLWQVSSNRISKYDLLCLLRDAFGTGQTIEPFEGMVADMSLDSSAFCARTGYKPPSWSEMISDLASDASAYEQWRINDAS